MPIYGYAIVAIGTLTWLLPFLVHRQSVGAPQQIDQRARWGVVLVALSYSLLWQNRFWLTAPATWRLVLSVSAFILAAALSRSGTVALGRQWRIDAGLSADHRLVRSGPYRFVRHPIYTSMLCLLLGTGLIVSPLPLLVAATVVFMIGTEIRVRAEDALLENRFGDDFRKYRAEVPAYLPWRGLHQCRSEH